MMREKNTLDYLVFIYCYFSYLNEYYNALCNSTIFISDIKIVAYTAKPVLMITSKKQPPVNNGQSEAITTSLKLTYH
jgi:hypothetical protein